MQSEDSRPWQDVPHNSPPPPPLSQTELEPRSPDRASLQVHDVEVRLQQPAKLQRPRGILWRLYQAVADQQGQVWDLWRPLGPTAGQWYFSGKFAF